MTANNAEKKVEWIDVNKALPLNEDMVLIYPEPDFDDFGRIVTAFYSQYDGGTNGVKKGNWYCFDPHGYEFKIYKVTHWTVIPRFNPERTSDEQR